MSIYLDVDDLLKLHNQGFLTNKEMLTLAEHFVTQVLNDDVNHNQLGSEAPSPSEVQPSIIALPVNPTSFEPDVVTENHDLEATETDPVAE